MYKAADSRYDKMTYDHLGKSGLRVPKVSLGLWNNFGDNDRIKVQREIIEAAFDHGITYFDLANVYGPPAGATEKNFGRIFKEDLKPYRNEMVIATKAGYHHHEGPYGEFGSRKHIIDSCNESLKNLGLEYVDIFYSHRPDPNTPFEETADALNTLVRQGKATYIGISNYNAEQTAKMIDLLKERHTPVIVHQPSYNMFDRWIEPELQGILKKEGIGTVVYSPLAQGLLTDRYLDGIPKDSRAARSDNPFLSVDRVEATLSKVRALNKLALGRGQSLAQMALAWNLRGDVTSVIIGASRVSQLEDNLKALDNLKFTDQELQEIETILK